MVRTKKSGQPMCMRIGITEANAANLSGYNSSVIRGILPQLTEHALVVTQNRFSKVRAILIRMETLSFIGRPLGYELADRLGSIPHLRDRPPSYARPCDPAVVAQHECRTRPPRHGPQRSIGM